MLAPDEPLSPRVTASGGMLPAMASYAQNFEDVMLRRALQDIEGGFYIDVGAFEPDHHSVSRWFYDTGWNGINVEPNPPIHRRLCRERPRDINLDCAVGGECTQAPFWLVGETGLSSLHPEFQDGLTAGEIVSKIDVTVLTLDAIVAQYAPDRVIDFLKIDVEGAEADALRGAQLHRNRPRIVVVEATPPMSQEPAWADWEPILLENAYRFVWFDGLNRFYVRDEDRARTTWFRLPPCCFDNFRLIESGAVARLQAIEAASRSQGEEIARLKASLAAEERSVPEAAPEPAGTLPGPASAAADSADA